MAFGTLLGWDFLNFRWPSRKPSGQLSLGQFFRASPSVVQDITCQPLKERMQGMAIWTPLSCQQLTPLRNVSPTSRTTSIRTQNLRTTRRLVTLQRTRMNNPGYLGFAAWKEMNFFWSRWGIHSGWLQPQRPQQYGSLLRLRTRPNPRCGVAKRWHADRATTWVSWICCWDALWSHSCAVYSHQSWYGGNAREIQAMSLRPMPTCLLQQPSLLACWYIWCFQNCYR